MPFNKDLAKIYFVIMDDGIDILAFYHYFGVFIYLILIFFSVMINVSKNDILLSIFVLPSRSSDSFFQSLTWGS